MLIFELVNMWSLRGSKQELHFMKSNCSVRDCLGEPVETPESDPPLDVESLSLLHGTEADRRMVTVELTEEERERELSKFSETLEKNVTIN